MEKVRQRYTKKQKTLTSTLLIFLGLMAMFQENQYSAFTSLNSSDTSEIWIGLRAELISQSVNYIWENCDEFSQSGGEFWMNDRASEGCIALSKTFKAIDCYESRPYICEANATVPCFDEVDWPNENVIAFYNDGMRYIRMQNCEGVCLTGACIAYQSIFDGTCQLMEASLSSGNGPSQFYARSLVNSLAYIDLNVYTDVTATAALPMASCSKNVSPSSTIELSSAISGSSQHPEETTTIQITTDKQTSDITTEQQFDTTTTGQEVIEEITTNLHVSYLSNSSIESSESQYRDNVETTTTAGITEPLTEGTQALKETPITTESSTHCPRGGMTSEMISEKIRQIAEDIEGEGMKIDDTCNRVISENVAGNQCAGDRTFPRGAELMSSVNEIRKEIKLSKIRGN